MNDYEISLENVLHNIVRFQWRVRFHYGNTVTGQDWLEEHDVAGLVGLSMGPKQIRILIHSSRSTGGGALLENCIVRIRNTWQEVPDLIRHPLYHYPPITMKPCHIEVADGRLLTCSILVDGKEHANFKDEKAARRWLKKMGLELYHDVVLKKLQGASE